MSYIYSLNPKASDQLKRLSKKNPQQAATIVRKIKWLAEHADEVEHQPLQGTPFFSLHSGSYRIPYLLDKEHQRIIIDDIGHHDEVYSRVNRLK